MGSLSKYCNTKTPKDSSKNYKGKTNFHANKAGNGHSSRVQ
uniref:Uncharacterized protein n=1 Tax=Rhizophora mucronata TaxID=61149 RepID=A0A2P2MYP1_RHIMU